MRPVRPAAILAGWSLLLPLPVAATAQAPPGSALWRVAGQTLVQPAALAEGAVAVFWNPARGEAGEGRVTIGFEAVHGAEATGVSGVLAGARVRAGPAAHVGLLVGRMSVNDLVRTSTSPAPEPGAIPFSASVIGVSASATPVAGKLRLGLSALAHRSVLDLITENTWTLDGGVWFEPVPGLSFAASTHFLSRTLGSHPQQDVFGAASWKAWQGPLWGAPSTLTLRAGLAGAHGGGLDRLVGFGLAVGEQVGLDALLAREDRYGNAAIRGVVGLRVSTQHYRVTLARDNGMNEIGAAFRFGLEATLK
ncbi:MAG: hypothetical protein ACREN5_00475 [Gemmatimonadales bacterium]